MIHIYDYLIDFKPAITTGVELHYYWRDYISRYEELAKILNDANSGDGIHDDTIITNVFDPFVSKIGRLESAHGKCLSFISELQATLTGYFSGDMNIVLYVGNGVGAGWYTGYKGLPSLLLGFENILILNWDSTESLSELIVHEFGHLLHENLRERSSAGISTLHPSALKKLYSEGFATYVESIVLKDNSFPTLEEGNNHLANWIKDNYIDICREYALRIQNDADVKDFFGSWYTYKGYRQVGYYLGYCIMCELSKNHTLHEIANLSECELAHKITNILTGR